MYRIPEQGMTEYEVLSRGSCFAVTTERTSTERTAPTFLFSAHVAAPYQFPHLYPNARDWLEFVEPKHVRVFVEIWDEDVQQFEIESIRKHVSRDVACGSICEFTKDYDFNPMRLVPDIKIEPRQDIICEGHNIIDDDGIPERLDVRGHSFFRTDHQVFLSTDDVLPHGMCGGPVISNADHSPALLGLLEGSIPIGTVSEHTHGEIGKLLHDRHGAVCVESHDLYGLVNMKDGLYEPISC